MIIGKVDRGIVALARRRAAQTGDINKSFTDGKGKVVGFVGELMLSAFFRANDIACKIVDKYKYDIIAGPDNVKIEVKSMSVSSVPRGTYGNPVSAHNGFQDGYYAFIRVLWKNKKDFEQGGDAYLTGFYPSKQFKQDSTFYREGEKDAAGYVNRFPCWSIPIEDVWHWAEMKPIIQSTTE